MSELQKWDLDECQMVRMEDGDYYDAYQADTKIGAMQKRIDKLESAMHQDINKTGGNLRLEEALKND